MIVGQAIGSLLTHTIAPRLFTHSYVLAVLHPRLSSIRHGIRSSERQLVDAHHRQSQLARDESEHPSDSCGRTARHHSRGSGKPSHRDWLLVTVVPATGTNGKCLEEVAVKMLKFDHHASEAASPISQRYSIEITGKFRKGSGNYW